MPAARKYTDAVRDRSVRLVADLRRDDASLTVGGAVRQVGERMKVPAATLRKWVQQDAREGPAASPSLVESVRSGSRLAALRALRDVIAETVAKTDSARDVASLSRQLMDVLGQIEAVEKTGPEERGTPLDELEKRRVARESGSADRSRAEGGVVAR